MNEEMPLYEVFARILRRGEAAVKYGLCISTSNFARCLREAGTHDRSASNVRSILGSQSARYAGVFSWIGGRGMFVSYSPFAYLLDGSVISNSSKNPREVVRKGQRNVEKFLNLPDDLRKEVYGLSRTDGCYLYLVLGEGLAEGDRKGILNTRPKVGELVSRLGRAVGNRKRKLESIGGVVKACSIRHIGNADDKLRKFLEVNTQEIPETWGNLYEVHEHAVKYYFDELGIRAKRLGD